MPNSRKKTNQRYYTHLVISRKKQFTLISLISIAFAGCTFFIFQQSMNESHWLTMVLPISVPGALFTLFPPTESWEYKPWQNTPERVEQNFDN